MKALDRLRRSPRWLAAALVLALLVVPLASARAAITGEVKLQIDLTDLRTSGTEQAQSKISQAFTWPVSNGTGANQFSLCWQGVRTLSSGANEDIDVVGSLTNLFGAAVFAQVKFIAISSAAANTTVLTVTRPTGTTGVPFLVTALDAFTLGPSDFFAITRRASGGITVAAATDLINVANAAGASATYTMVICGNP